jgi:hypothetical protein
LRLLAAQIPDKGEQLLQYHGYYGNVSQGKRKKQKPEEKTEIRPSAVSRELKIPDRIYPGPSIAAPQRRPALRECAQRPPCFSLNAVLYPF